MNTALTIVLSIFGGGSLVTLLEFFINRYDEKHGKYNAIIEEIKKIHSEIGNIRKELDEDRATNARIRILNFSDEIQHYVQHSRESFDQVHEDIDMYRTYCNTHDDYENSKANAAIENIETVYKKCLAGEESFLN